MWQNLSSFYFDTNDNWGMETFLLMHSSKLSLKWKPTSIHQCADLWADILHWLSFENLGSSFLYSKLRICPSLPRHVLIINIVTRWSCSFFKFNQQTYDLWWIFLSNVPQFRLALTKRDINIVLVTYDVCLLLWNVKVTFSVLYV